MIYLTLGTQPESVVYLSDLNTFIISPTSYDTLPLSHEVQISLSDGLTTVTFSFWIYMKPLPPVPQSFSESLKTLKNIGPPLSKDVSRFQEISLVTG